MPSNATVDSAHEFMTKEEVCQYLRIHRATVDRLRRDGKLKATKAGKSVRFHRADVQAYIEENTH